MEHRAGASTSFSRGAAQSSDEVGIANCIVGEKGRGRGRLPNGHTQEYVSPKGVANTMFLWPP